MPAQHLVSDVTHVALAFMSPAVFNQAEPSSSWPLFTTVEKARSQFVDGTAILVAVGGWGDTAGFETAAATENARKLFAHNVRLMVEATGADGELNGPKFAIWSSNFGLGVDIDWEYPGLATTLIIPLFVLATCALLRLRQRERRGLQADTKFGQSLGDRSVSIVTRGSSLCPWSR